MWLLKADLSVLTVCVLSIILCRPSNSCHCLCRKYVPEVKHLPVKYLFEPWKAPLKVQKAARCIVGEDYPDPVADHIKQRIICVERLKDLCFSLDILGNTIRERKKDKWYSPPLWIKLINDLFNFHVKGELVNQDNSHHYHHTYPREGFNLYRRILVYGLAL